MRLYHCTHTISREFEVYDVKCFVLPQRIFSSSFFSFASEINCRAKYTTFASKSQINFNLFFGSFHTMLASIWLILILQYEIAVKCLLLLWQTLCIRLISMYGLIFVLHNVWNWKWMANRCVELYSVLVLPAMHKSFNWKWCAVTFTFYWFLWKFRVKLHFRNLISSDPTIFVHKSYISQRKYKFEIEF